MKTLTFATLFPHLRGWVQNLITVWPAYIVKPNFAIYEVFHILSLVLLGGTSLLIGLRLLGRGLTEETPREVYRNVRWWLHLGVAGIILSGVLIGMANAERLYDSSAFLVKMLALLAGVIFTYGVTRPVALADGEVSVAARAWAAVSGAVFAAALWVFLTGGLIMPGLFHVMTAAGLVVLVAVGGRTRWIYAAGCAALLLAFYLSTHVFIAPDDLAHSDPANLTIAWLSAAWIAAFAAVRMVQGRRGGSADGRAADARVVGGGRLTQAIGYGFILVWVTAAAAGRWIAFA